MLKLMILLPKLNWDSRRVTVLIKLDPCTYQPYRI